MIFDLIFSPSHHRTASTNAALYLVLCATAFVAIVLIYWAAMSAPFWDAFAWFEWLRQYSSGETSLLDILVSRQNEHPYGVPGLIFFSWGALWNYDLRSMSYLSLAAIIGIALLLADEFRHRSMVAAVCAVIIAVSLRQSFNLLYGFQVGFVLTVLFGLVAIRSASEPGLAHIALMALSLITGGFSSAGFIAVYPAIFLVLFWGRKSRWSWVAAIVAGVICAGWLAAYLPQFHGAKVPNISLSARALGLTILAGSPLVGNRVLSFAVGAVVLIGFCWFALRARRDDQRIIAFALFSLGMISITALGRGSMEGLNPSRYATFGIPFASAVIGLAIVYYRRAAYPLLAVTVLSYVGAAIYALPEAEVARSRDLQMNYILANYRNLADDELGYLSPGPAPMIRRIVAMMDEKDIGPFAHREQYELAAHSAINFVSQGAARVEVRNNVAGPGFIVGAIPFGRVVRAELTGIRLSPPATGGDRKRPSGKTRNFGIIFYDENGAALENIPVSLEGGGTTAHLWAVAPTGATRAGVYVYSPSRTTIVKFDNAVAFVPITN